MDSLFHYLRELQKLLRRRGESRERAEDLVQEAFLRMQLYCKEVGAIRKPEAFLMRTALNLSVDTRRREHRDIYEAEPVESFELPDIGPTPDEVFAAEERLVNMWQALDKAGERSREAFFLHRLQGLSYAEIAQRQGVSVSMVEKHIASAVTLLAIERQRE